MRGSSLPSGLELSLDLACGHVELHPVGCVFCHRNGDSRDHDGEPHDEHEFRHRETCAIAEYVSQHDSERKSNGEAIPHPRARIDSTRCL